MVRNWSVNADVVRFVSGIDGLRCKFGAMSVTSWGRSVLHNASLPGSARDSQHLRWTACDVVYDRGYVPDMVLLLNACVEFGLRVVREVDHDHFELL